MDYSLITLSPNVSSSSQMFTTNGLLGNTIEEKTRRILGWTEHTAPSMTVGPLAPAAAHVNQRKADKGRKTKSASISAAAPYPYSLLANESNRGRKSSCPSLCNMNDPILRQQLTPPPSPVSNVSIVSLPRQGRTPPTILPPPPPAYHSLQTARKSVACEYYSDNSVSSPECLTILPISPVSPAAPSNLIQDGVCVMSSSSSSSSSRISTSEVFERLRKEVPHLPKEQSKFRILVQTVANVIELETKLAHLQEQTRTLSNMLSQNGNNGAEPAHASNGGQHKSTYDQQIAVDTSLPSPSSINNECVSRQSNHYPLDTNFITTADVPDDLRGIDVTAFKSMMCSPHSVSTSPVASYQNICFNPMKVKNFNSSQFINSADDGCSNYFENIINYDCESFPSLNYNGLDPLLVDTSSN